MSEAWPVIDLAHIPDCLVGRTPSLTLKLTLSYDLVPETQGLLFELERCHFLKGESSVVLETLCFIGSEYKRDRTHPEFTEFLTTRARVTLQVRFDVCDPIRFIANRYKLNCSLFTFYIMFALAGNSIGGCEFSQSRRQYC